ncbi:protein of unknown function (plasmid) [Azospirillum baldaniorum]|uniref:STAS domain-containing protein n=1 Tax=Azospirillum baldaniorum TaxID=1064539 RepID=A0A9P1JWN0_9PROT|nr:protein of unknown function [Azospirillum baldaniorum]
MSIAAWRHRKGRAGRGMARERAWLESSRAGDGEWRLAALGHWDLKAAGSLSGTLDRFALDGGGAVSLDLSRLDAMDTVGAYLLSALSDRLKAAGHGVDLAAIRPEHAALFDAVREVGPPPVERAQTHRPILDMLERTGRTAVDGLREGRDLLSFLGLIAITFGRLIVNPRRLRFRSVMFHIEQTGLNALPILGLLSFLIGVVLGLPGGGPAPPFRGGAVRGQPAGRVDPARDRHPDDRHHRGRALRFRLHRADRHHEGEPGGGRHQHAGAGRGGASGGAARAGPDDHPAASGLLRRHHGAVRRCCDELRDAGHHLRAVHPPASRRRHAAAFPGWTGEGAGLRAGDRHGRLLRGAEGVRQRRERGHVDHQVGGRVHLPGDRPGRGLLRPVLLPQAVRDRGAFRR